MAADAVSIPKDMKAILDAQKQSQMEAIAIQVEMSKQDRLFNIQSGLIEKGDKANEKVGDRLAN